MLAASVFLGVCVSRLFSEQMKIQALNSILCHFSPQRSGEAFLGGFFNFLKFSAPDFFAALIALIFSFSFINYVISDMIIVIYGVKLGIGCALIAATGISGIDKLIYFAFRPLLVILIVLFLYRMALMSLSIRRFTQNGRFAPERRSTLTLLLSTLCFCGVIMIINGLYCLCLYI
jgi:hypothetical protein